MMPVEHSDPNGGDKPENLCLACPTCNLSTSTATSATTAYLARRNRLAYKISPKRSKNHRFFQLHFSYPAYTCQRGGKPSPALPALRCSGTRNTDGKLG